MIRLLKYFKGYRITALLGPIFKFLEALFELLIPLVVAQIIDKGILAGNKSYCIRMTAFMVLLGFIGFISSLTAQFFAARSATGFAANVRLALFKHIQTLSFSDADNLGTVTMVTRLTNDISRMQNGVNMALRLLLRSPFIVFGAMIMAFTRDAKAAVVFVIVIVVLFIIVYCIIAITVPFYREIQSRLDRVLNLTRENVNGVRVIRAFCNEENETEKFKTANERLHSLQVATGNIAAFTNPLTYAAINVGIIFLIYVCGIRVNMGYMSAGTTVALYNYMSQILVELIKLANLLITISGAMACANRIADVMDIKPGMESGSAKLSELYSEKTDTPVVEFVNASVSYGGEGNGALNDVNFKIYPGETVGIIGGTGSGKSTLAGLIPRFYDVSKGSVKVMGKDVRELDTEELRKNIGIVMQKAVLFKGNIKSNLEFSEPRARNEEMRAALEMAQIGELDIEHEIAQGGNNLSGGQKQRVSIARALVRKPKILILDDSYSALDFATEYRLRSAVGGLDYNPVKIIISQRSSTVMHADKIVVLDDGHVTGIGNHEDLLKYNETYREIYNSQIDADAPLDEEEGGGSGD